MLIRQIMTPFVATAALSMTLLSNPAIAADVDPYPAVDDVFATEESPFWIIGHLEAAGGGRWPHSDVFDTDPLGLANVFGRANLALGPLNFEVDIGGWAFWDDGNSDSTLQAIGHLWLKFPSAAVGIFGGTTDYFGTDIPTFGGEGQVYLGNLTLGAQGSYNWDGANDVWGVRGDADFYPDPDLKLGGDIQYWNVGGSDIWQGGVDVEKRFTGTPVSLGGSLSYFAGEDFGAWTGMGHVRLFMDPAGSTLQWHDRAVPFEFSLPLFGG
jgi:hypothetical protein